MNKYELATYLGLPIDSEIEIVNAGSIVLTEGMKIERRKWQAVKDEGDPLLKEAFNKALDSFVKKGILVKAGE